MPRDVLTQLGEPLRLESASWAILIGNSVQNISRTHQDTHRSHPLAS